MIVDGLGVTERSDSGVNRRGQVSGGERAKVDITKGEYKKRDFRDREEFGELQIKSEAAFDMAFHLSIGSLKSKFS